MKITSSYACRISDRTISSFLSETTEIYREACRYLLSVVDAEWEQLKDLTGKDRNNRLEKLIHATKNNPDPKYKFDHKFYKFPSYFRRSACQAVLGSYQAWKSSCENWRKNPDGKKPGFPSVKNLFPAFYKKDMYKEEEDGCIIQLKVFKNNDWTWIPVKLRKSDVDYIRRHCGSMEKSSPTLIRKGRVWKLVFAFEQETELGSKDFSDQKILAVDLGINNAAVCCVMTADGTVLGRKFLHLSREKDRLQHQLNKIKKAQRHGNRRNPGLWRMAKNTNTIIARKTAKFIIDTAVHYQVDVIVFEHLEISGKKRGSKKQRLHLWKAQDVQKIVEGRAHRLGMRISRVCAWGTSRLAFDGSGCVERAFDDSRNYSVCRFPNGKVYNADLSASYNIGARYFIRCWMEYLKSNSERMRLDIPAKVPECSRRSTCTYASLIRLVAEVQPVRTVISET